MLIGGSMGTASYILVGTDAAMKVRMHAGQSHVLCAASFFMGSQNGC